MPNAPSATRADVYAALARKSGFEVLRENETPNQLRIMGRSLIDRWPFFSLVVFRLINLSQTPGNPWTCDISKQYLVSGERIRYSWRLIFQAPGELAAQYGAIARAILETPAPARAEVTSITLPGYKPGQVRGGVNAKGKGAEVAGTLPMALTRGVPRG